MPEQLLDENHYVLLMPGAPEEFLSRAEMLAFLQSLLQEYPQSV
ncbi:MAG: chlororespiratory reduction protein 7, partial [Cyanobacteria bacterium P01_E01_bin.48]